MNFEFMIKSILSMKVIWVFFWSLICMISYILVFLLWIFDLVRPTRSIFLTMGRGALWWVQSSGVLSQWQKGQQDTHVPLLLRITRWGLILHEYISSTSCHRSYCITLFLHELNTLDAWWIVVDVWSNSSRCRQESVYKSWTWCLYIDHFLGYWHNYLIFYQLPNSNLFTHRVLFLERSH